MSRATTILAALLLLAVLPAGAIAGGGTGAYEWSISASSADPNVHTIADFPGGVATAYLWFTGCNAAASQPGMASAEFGAQTAGDLTIIGFNPMNGFLNAGTATHPLFAVGGCEAGPVVAGSWTMLGGGTGVGAVSLVAVLANDVGPGFWSIVVDCDINGWEYPDYVRHTGLVTNGYSGALQDYGNGCSADAVEEESWGRVKSLYR